MIFKKEILRPQNYSNSVVYPTFTNLINQMDHHSINLKLQNLKRNAEFTPTIRRRPMQFHSFMERINLSKYHISPKSSENWYQPQKKDN